MHEIDVSMRQPRMRTVRPRQWRSEESRSDVACIKKNYGNNDFVSCFAMPIVFLPHSPHLNDWNGEKRIPTYCVRSVNAALVMLDGRCRPLMISCHNFLLMTSTKPPRAITKLYNSYKSNTDFAMMGNRLIGLPEIRRKKTPKKVKLIYIVVKTVNRSIVAVACVLIFNGISDKSDKKRITRTEFHYFFIFFYQYIGNMTIAGRKNEENIN